MNKFASKLKATKAVSKAPTSADALSALRERAKPDPMAQYSAADLKDVVVLSVKLPKVVRDAIRTQCSQKDIKLATEAKRWILENFDMPPGFEGDKILEDGRTKQK